MGDFLKPLQQCWPLLKLMFNADQKEIPYGIPMANVGNLDRKPNGDAAFEISTTENSTDIEDDIKSKSAYKQSQRQPHRPLSNLRQTLWQQFH